jgi:uncharacterized protein YndB with AHSA1/START domain
VRPPNQDTKLVVTKIIPASSECLFAAWTQPEQLKQWWGPESVTCIEAEVDLRVGGRYRIGNRFPDGRVVWITGKFHLIDAPHKLVYSWQVGTDSDEELVTVFFRPIQDGNTEVTITHKRIPDRTARESHQQGWFACLSKLALYIR